MQNGWYAAFGWVLGSGFFNAFLRLAAGYDVHPVAMLCQSMLVCAFVMFVIAGPGVLIKESFKEAKTWLYSVNYLVSTAMFIVMVKLISATEASLLTRFSVVMAFALAMLRGKSGLKVGWFGILMVLCGVLVVFFDVEDGHKWKIALLTFVFALTQALQFWFSETHRTSAKAQHSVRAQIRVTGAVMAATALVFASVLVAISWGSRAVGVDLYPIIPSFADFIDVDSLVFGAIYGAFGVAFVRYCEFVSTRRIGSEYFAAVITTSTISTLIFEYMFVWFGFYEPKPLTFSMYVAGGAIILGSLLVVVANQLGRKGEASNVRKLKAQNVLQSNVLWLEKIVNKLFFVWKSK